MCSREASRETPARIQQPVYSQPQLYPHHRPHPGLCRLPASPAARAEAPQAVGCSYGALAEMSLAGKKVPAANVAAAALINAADIHQV